MWKFTFVLLIVFFTLGFRSDKPAYFIYTAQLQSSSYEKLISEAKGADIVFFGELHDNPIAHWLELQVTKDLYTEKGGKLVLGAEMFEADNQVVLDEYLKGIITGKQFETEAKMWQNYATDYKPMVDFAQKNKIPFVATNIPRRYASLVSKGGLEALNQLSEEGKKSVAPLPITVDLTLPGYAEMMKMGGMHGMGGSTISAENIAKAQASKDATMAHFILKNWSEGKSFLHFNGSYHSNNFEGIIWYLKKANPALKIVTINTVEEADIKEPNTKHKGSASFVVAIPSDMIKSY